MSAARARAVLLAIGVAGCLAAGPAHAEPVGIAADSAVGDGVRLVAFDRADGTTAIYDDARGETVVVPRPPGCFAVGVGGDTLVVRCETPFSGRIAIDLPSGRERWRQAIDPNVGGAATALRRVGRHWLLYESFDRAGRFSVAVDAATGTRTVRDDRDRYVLDPDARSGRRRLCAPLRRPYLGLDGDERPFASFDGRALLTYGERNVQLRRCGSRRVLTLQRAYSNEGALAGGIATWTSTVARDGTELTAYDVRRRRRIGCATFRDDGPGPATTWTRTRRHLIHSTPRPDGTWSITRGAFPRGRCR